MDLPEAARFLHVAEQFLDLQAWFEVDDDGGREKRSRQFMTVPTGGRIPDSAIYHGSALLEGGRYVLHIYEILP